MKKQWIVTLLAVLLIFAAPSESKAISYDIKKPQQDSTQLQLQDMLMLFLLPHIHDAVNDYYRHLLKEGPMIYPYFVDVVEIQRKNGFRGFIFRITVEVTPVVGPHIAVGKDRITFEISARPAVKLINYAHLETIDLPPHWKHIVR